MKSTLHVLSKDGLKFYLTILPFVLLFICAKSENLLAQQSSLPCNTVTPWTPNSFDVDVDFSSTGLSCWDDNFLCVILGDHTPSNVVDNDLSNFASGTIVVGGSLTLSVNDPVNDYDAGNFAGFVISSGVLDFTVFSNITISTYLNNSPQETFTGFDLIGLNSALFDDPYPIGFVTSADYDEVEITFSAGIAVGTYNVHFVIMEGFCAGPALECNQATFMNSDTFPMTIDYANTGSIGLNLGDVDNPENAISLSRTDYASLNNLANVLDSLSIAIEEQVTDYPAGTFVGFDIENTTIAGIGLLENIVITTYLNGVQQEQISNDDLLLGVPVLNSTGRHTVGFVTSTAVDKVKFTLAQPINVNLGTTRVYSAIFREFCEGPPLPCNEQIALSSTEYPIYIYSANTGFTGAVCLGCTLEDVEAVIDGDPLSYAEIDITAGVATVGSISVRKELTDYPANIFAGFRIENVQLVDVDVLVGITISTYLDGTFVEAVSGTDILLTAGTDLLVNQGEFLAGFVTTATFDEVRISLTNLAMVNIGTTKVYEVVLGAFCPTEIICDSTYFLTTPEFPVYVDFQLTGLEGGVCALCEVEDPDEVITASNTDFASITITAGVLQSGSIAVRDALYVYPPGTVAGFVIEDLNDVLQADLFASLTISTYLDGNLQEFAFGANLIDAELLILFINPDAGVYNVGFETTLPFDEVRITVGSLANVINLIDVYGAFVDTQNSFGGDSLNCPNPPVAMDDSASTPEETPVIIDVLANDTDPDSPLGIPVVIDPPINGTATVNPGDSTITYTPDPNFEGIDSFTYAICDDGTPPLCDTASVIVNVTPVIDTSIAPGLDTIIETIPEDSMLVVCADSISTFPDPATSIALCGLPSNGMVTIIGVCATYTPDADFTGQDTFCLVVCDPNDPLICDTTIVIVIVTPVNDPPIAMDDADTTPEDTPVVIDVLDNDSDIDSPLGIPVVTDPPSNGTATVNPIDSTITYTPDPDFVGIDSFTYAICDDGTPPLCDTATVIITVTPVIDTIIIVLPEDSTLTVCADSLTTFTAPAASIALCGGPSDGNVTIVGTCATYTPDLGFNGQDTFCVVVCDPNNPLLCDTTIIIAIVDSLNNPPVAVDDMATTPEDTPVVIDVLDNDSDIDSPLNNPTITDQPDNGTVMVNPGDGSVTYTPDPDFVGVDTFTYSICDNGIPILCDTAQVIVMVTPVIDTIIEVIPEDSTLVVCADSLTTFTEPATSIALCDAPSNGMVTIIGVCATYTPDADFTGQDTFCLVVCDPNDPLLCDTTIVIVIITPLNDPPLAVDDAETTPEETPVVIDVLDNDSDIDSPLGIPLVTDPPSNGVATVNPVDSTITYVPDSNFVGVDSFMYAICDDGMPPLCDTALVVVTVTPVMDTLIVTIIMDSTLVICADSIATFTEPASSISICDPPTNGTVTIIGVCATYTPDPGFTGIDTFCLIVCDPNIPLLCDTTIIIVNVLPPGCVYINAAVYLEGSAINSNGEFTYTIPMRTTLNDIQVLPGQCYQDPFFGVMCTPPGQPYYEGPWFYNGTEGINYDSGGDPMLGDAGYPPSVVDWVLVSLRDNPDGIGGPICQTAALLHQDGTIEMIDSFACCGIDLMVSYYIVIEHRNHLIVMSDVPVPVTNDTVTYDFRNQQSYVDDPGMMGFFGAQKEILPGVYAMYAGNGDQYPLPQADTDINFDDRTYWEMNSGTPGIYNIADYNLNTDTNFNDRVLWEKNNGVFTSVPRD